MKKLVVYYSHDGNTKFVAETISKIIQADIKDLDGIIMKKHWNYEVTVGNEVSKVDNNEYAVKTIPAGRYARFSITGHVQIKGMIEEQ